MGVFDTSILILGDGIPNNKIDDVHHIYILMCFVVKAPYDGEIPMKFLFNQGKICASWSDHMVYSLGPWGGTTCDWWL